MHIHILGICGTFMGGVAALARELGHAPPGQPRDPAAAGEYALGQGDDVASTPAGPQQDGHQFRVAKCVGALAQEPFARSIVGGQHPHGRGGGHAAQSRASRTLCARRRG